VSNLAALAVSAAIAVRPHRACAQHLVAPRRVGVLTGSSSSESKIARQFRQGLRDAGYTEGRDVLIDWQSYGENRFAEEGGLMSFGTNFADLYRRSAGYVGKLLNGAKAGDLPIEQPTTFELVVNLKTAKAIGLTIPKSILLRADEVIR
jgi:hypothetical protein